MSNTKGYGRHDFLIIGSINLDILIKQERFPREGETLQVEDALIFPGGKGANQAIQIAKLGGDVAFCGAVGSGPFGPVLRKSLSGSRVDTTHLLTKPGSSGLGIVNYLNGGKLTATIVKGANYRLEKADIIERSELIEGAGFVILQHEIPEDLVELILEIAGPSMANVLVNAAPVRKISEKLIKNIDYLIVNEVESEFFLQREISRPRDVLEAGVHFVKNYGLTLIVTLGAQGSVLITEKEQRVIPAIDVPVVETTGAGDSYIGTLAYFLSKGLTLYNACCYANCASALTVQTEGAQESMPDYAHVAAMYSKNYK